jgi:CheY-like chemotaxis protein
VARIIVVDDDASLRTLLRALLEDAGHEVVEAADGKAALQAIGDGGADIVLTDLFMPGMDGIELIRAIRREHPTLNVVALSGGGFSGTIDLLPVARRLGAVEIVNKPFTLTTIRAAVERALLPPSDRPTVWVRDEGRWYLPGDRVQWVHDPEDRLLADRDGPYEVESSEPDPTRSPGRWQRVNLRKIPEVAP